MHPLTLFYHLVSKDAIHLRCQMGKLLVAVYDSKQKILNKMAIMQTLIYIIAKYPNQLKVTLFCSKYSIM